MPSINAMMMMAAAGGGAALGGYSGWNKARDDENMDTSDRAGYTVSSIVAGATGGLLLKAIGIKPLIGGAKLATGSMGLAYKGATTLNASRVAITSGMRSILGKVGAGQGLKSLAPVKGPMAGLALFALGIGAIAYGSHSNPETAYAIRDDYGEAQYQDTSVRSRLNMMNADGNVVLGLHNLRHVGEGG